MSPTASEAPQAGLENAAGKPSRRGFLLFGFGGLFASVAYGLWGCLRFLIPNILYEPSPEFKVGRPEELPEGSVLFEEERRVFVFHDDKGFYAVTAVCTHLGCTVRWSEGEQTFKCPCHGSWFNRDGAVVSGPAPKPLDWYRLHRAPDGQLVVDKRNKVDPDYRLVV